MAFVGRSSWCIVFLLWVSWTSAERDDGYYPLGITNPNIQQSHYWKDSDLVLQDLSQFRKLYVKFHNCAWSPMEQSGGGGGQRDHREESYCPGDATDVDGGDESDSWYLGSGPCYRANAGFTLYGVLDGALDVGCSRKTYINSFVTTGGVDAFVQALYSAGVTSLQQYSSYSNNNNNGGDGQQQGANDNTVSSYCYASDNGENNNGEAMSYTIGCHNGQFVPQRFTGSVCNGRNLYQSNLNVLEDFNRILLNQGKCVAIYDAKSDNAQSGYNQGQQQQQQQGNNNNNGQYYTPSVALLSNSRACNPHDPLVACPDPYGKLQEYTRTVERAVSIESINEDEIRQYRSRTAFLFLVGLALNAVALFLLSRKSSKLNVQFRGLKRYWKQRREEKRAQREAKKVAEQERRLATKTLETPKRTELQVQSEASTGAVGIFHKSEQPKLGEIKKSPPHSTEKDIPPEWNAGFGSPILRVFGAPATASSKAVKPKKKELPAEQNPPSEWDTSGPVATVFGSCAPTAAVTSDEAKPTKVKDLKPASLGPNEDINRSINEDPVFRAFSAEEGARVTNGAALRPGDGPHLPDESIEYEHDAVLNMLDDRPRQSRKSWFGKKR